VFFRRLQPSSTVDSPGIHSRENLKALASDGTMSDATSSLGTSGLPAKLFDRRQLPGFDRRLGLSQILEKAGNRQQFCGGLLGLALREVREKVVRDLKTLGRRVSRRRLT
jgi:hypothetical protein